MSHLSLTYSQLPHRLAVSMQRKAIPLAVSMVFTLFRAPHVLQVSSSFTSYTAGPFITNLIAVVYLQNFAAVNNLFENHVHWGADGRSVWPHP